jgi:hypothetical protein
MAHVNSTGAAHHRIAEDILVLTAGLGTGAGLMYLCDPKRGRVRRGRLIAEFSRFIRRDENRMAKRAKDLLNRVGGLAAEAVSALTEEEPVADEVLIERVRARMGHIVSHPHEVQVHAKDGVVTLEGLVTHAEKRRFREAVRTISGVKRVHDRLTTRSLLAPGLLMGLAAGLALLGRTGASRTHPAGGGAS